MELPWLALQSIPADTERPLCSEEAQEVRVQREELAAPASSTMPPLRCLLAAAMLVTHAKPAELPSESKNHETE